MLLRYSYVFNADQVKGWDEVQFQDDATESVLLNVDAFIERLGSDRRYDSDSAYSPEHDRIFMPDRTAFYDTPSGNCVENFYAVLLHEQVHWRGHPSRLAHDFSEKSDQRAMLWKSWSRR